MKIMRCLSWRHGFPCARAGATMAGGTDFVPHIKEMTMTWQTPQAQDFRFGFEITMYIAAR
jgi:coenzyme PQQ precursor peptide PqqA